MDTNESRETALLSSASAHPALAPTTIGPLALRNRLAVAPMSRVSTLGDGVATEHMRDYYTSFARGGFGLVVTEGTYTDLTHSQAYRRQPGIATDAQAAAWTPIVRAVHEQGTAVVLQLMHAGALSQENGYRPTSIGPSAVVPRGNKMSDYGGTGAYALPRAMTEEDIADVVEGFARAAVRARNAGFDGVEIHGANGYLLDQFLTTYTNQRTDRWGGTVENRIRLTAEVVAASIRAAGPGFVVGVRVSQTKVNDLAYRWPGGSRDAAIIFEELRAAGADYVHLASEGADAAETARFADGGNVLEVARRVTGRPVIANGGLAEPSRLARLFREEQADVVALGRAALANPDWPLRLARGADFERFDRAMLHPFASLENAEQWRSRRALPSPR